VNSGASSLKWPLSALLFAPGVAYAQHGGEIFTLALSFLSFLIGIVVGAIVAGVARRRLKTYIVLCALWATAYFVVACFLVAGMPIFIERVVEVMIITVGAGAIVFSGGYGIAFVVVSAILGRT